MAAASSQAKRHIPRRAMNEKKKATRVSCWVNGQKRKKDRVKAQGLREQKNRELRAQGLPTPWEEACAERLARREAERALVAATATGGQS